MSNSKYKSSAKLTDPLDRLEVSNHAKIKLIRKFQRIEENFDCCASPYSRACNQHDCLWRDECLVMAQG